MGSFFILSTMLGAFSSASNSATPRATQLLIQDNTTQNVLSSFVGAFVFSMVGIISLQTDIYGDRGKVIIFVVTLAVVIFVVFTLLRWISHLMKFGRLGETTQRVETVTALALKKQATMPFAGAQPLPEQWQPTASYRKIYSPLTGYVQHIDDAFVLGIDRSFDYDPRFALCALSEVASRALSPAFVDSQHPNKGNYQGS